MWARRHARGTHLDEGEEAAASQRHLGNASVCGPGGVRIMWFTRLRRRIGAGGARGKGRVRRVTWRVVRRVCVRYARPCVSRHNREPPGCRRRVSQGRATFTCEHIPAAQRGSCASPEACTGPYTHTRHNRRAASRGPAVTMYMCGRNEFDTCVGKGDEGFVRKTACVRHYLACR